MARCRLIFVVLAAAGTAVLAGFAASAGSDVAARPSTPPVCSPALRSQRPLTKVGTAMVSVTGNPFGVASTANGEWSFVSTLSDGVAVIEDRRGKSRVVQEIALPGETLLGEALTHDGRYLVVADGSGAAVLSVGRAERGAPHALLGRLSASGPSSNFALQSAIEVAISADDRFIFVSLESANEIAVFNLRRAVESGFHQSALVGTIPLGLAAVGMAVSPDGNWLYATSEGARRDTQHGTISVIDIRRAETRPRHSVVASVAAGCDPVRVAVSPDGKVVWVTARESNSLLAFSASRLRTDSQQAPLARVRVGTAPVGLALLRDGARIVVADSNRFAAPGQSAKLTVIDTRAALAHKSAVIGAIPAGTFPRELSVDMPQKRLLITNFGSSQLEVVDMTHIP
jgi:DNA-binding beta-propeller fold protein YncE